MSRLHAQQHSFDIHLNNFVCLSEQKEIAINLYREGILELERGINIDVWQGSGEKWTKAQRLHDKMQTNLAMAKDRLNFLGELVFLMLYYYFIFFLFFTKPTNVEKIPSFSARIELIFSQRTQTLLGTTRN